MSSTSINLGYLPKKLALKTNDISLNTLSDFDKNICSIKQRQNIHDGWYYSLTQLPRTRIFGLPQTHCLTHDHADSEEHLKFLVWCLGFFNGMYLTTTKAGFVDATPIEPNKLTDFILADDKLGEAIVLSEAFWQQHKNQRENIKRIEGIIHALFISCYPANLDFERFTWIYTALDACYRLKASIALTQPGHNFPHAKRIGWICKQFRIKTPTWAKPNNRASQISIARNATLHEALFFDEALGFSIYGGNTPLSSQINVLLEMQNLVCRFLVALLGKPNCAYVSSPVNTQALSYLDFV